MGLEKVFLKKAAKEVTKEATEETLKNVGKNAVKSGIKGHALLGAGAGAVIGAGGGGLTALATGADDDDTKAMIVTGAIAGAATGGILGGGAWAKRNYNVTGHWYQQVAEGMSNGPSNRAAGGGVNKFFESVKESPGNIDNFGENISKKISRGARQEQVNLIKDIKRANPEKGTQEILRDLKNSEGILGNIYTDNANQVTKMVHIGNTVGGAAQGALLGAGSGALIGGVAGGVDEDETFIGGAIKGTFIGGSLGGIGGGISGYANNSARLLRNTTQNVNSLFN